MRRIWSLLLSGMLLSSCALPFSPPADSTPAPVDGAPADDGSTDGAAQEQVTISYAAWESERGIYETLAKTFMADNPGISVVIVPLDDLVNIPDQGKNNNSQEAVLRRVVTGADTAPSIFVSPDLLQSNLMLDLKPLMDADPSFRSESFYKGVLERFTRNGQIKLLPRYTYVQVLSYNKELFSQANIPEPGPTWTWNDMVGLAEQFARKNGNTVETYGLIESSSGFSPLLSLLYEQKIDLITKPSSQVNLDQPEIATEIERITKLANSGALFRYPTEAMEKPIDPQQLIRDGRAAMWSSDFTPLVQTNKDGVSEPVELPFEIGLVSYPSTGMDMVGAYSEGYIASSGTAHPNEAWKWIDFLSQQQIANGQPETFLSSPNRVPARSTYAEQVGFWNGVEAKTRSAYEAAIASPPAVQMLQNDYLAYSALADVLNQAHSDQQYDIAKGLTEAQNKLQEQIATAQLTPSPTADTNPVAVATPAPQTAPEGATLVRFLAPDYQALQLRQLARAFNEANPDVFVQVRSTSVLTQVQDLGSVAEISDCFAWYSQPQNAKEFDALLDLQPLFDADTSFPQSDYPPLTLSPFTVDGKVYGLPWAYNMRTLTYNRTAFTSAGIAEPNGDWSMQDFLAAAQALTTGEGDTKQYGYVSISGPYSDLFFFTTQFGAELTSGSGEDIQPHFNDPAVVKSLQWYVDLFKTHKVMPEPVFSYRRDEPGREDPSYMMVRDGRAGMWFDNGTASIQTPIDGPIPIDGAGPVPTSVPAELSFEPGIAPLPVASGGLTPMDLWVRGMYISRTTENQAGCWTWLKYLSGDLSLIQNELPARLSLLDSEDAKGKIPQNVLDIATAYRPLLNKPIKLQNTGMFGVLDTYWLFKAIDEAAKGEKDLATGLDEAQSSSTKYLACLKELGINKTATCANQVDPTYQGYNTEDPLDGPGPRPMG